MIQLIQWTVFQGSDGKKGYGEINIYFYPAVDVFFFKHDGKKYDANNTADGFFETRWEEGVLYLHVPHI